VPHEDGLVATRREAQAMYYPATEGPTLEVIRVLNELYCHDRGR
jgi:hypothetical protein